MRQTAPALLVALAATMVLAAPATRASAAAVGNLVIAQGEMLRDEIMAARTALQSHQMRSAMDHLDRAESMLRDARMSAGDRDRAMQDLANARRMVQQGDTKGAMAAIDAVIAHAGGQG